MVNCRMHGPFFNRKGDAGKMKKTDKKMLAVDLGASSGRVMAGSFDGEKISVEELHRFSNDPVTLGGTMYWDFLRLFHEIKQGLLKSKKAIEILGGKIVKTDKFLLANTDIRRALVVIRKERNTPKKYPRKAGVPAKEPLK